MIVVDSAALIDALSAAAGTDDLRAYLATEGLHAPTLVDFEVVAALRSLTLGGHMSAVSEQKICSLTSTICPFSVGHPETACDGARSSCATMSPPMTPPTLHWPRHWTVHC